MEEINTEGYKQKWISDPKGYFLIRIDRKNKLVEVGHCKKNNKVIKIFKGKSPESLMYKIIDEDLISCLDHAAYLGKEIEKAFIALNFGFEYYQDSDLKINENIK